MFDEAYIEECLRAGDVRPANGTLWAMAFDPRRETIRVDGVGTLQIALKTESGIVIPEKGNPLMGAYTSVQYVVLALGRESRDQWSWEDGGVYPYVIIAARAAAGLNQGSGKKYMNFKWDEIMAVGNPEGEWPPMSPAPGYVMIEEEQATSERESGLVIASAEVNYRMENPSIIWGRVVSVPKDGSEEDVSVGDRVAVPYSRAAGGTEWLEAEGGLRVVPSDEILMVDDAAD